MSGNVPLTRAHAPEPLPCGHPYPTEAMVRTEYDMVVIGGGMAGLNAAQRAVDAGLSVAVIERDRPGGTCPIRGCIPTKALVRSAEIAHEARRAAVSASGSARWRWTSPP